MQPEMNSFLALVRRGLIGLLSCLMVPCVGIALGSARAVAPPGIEDLAKSYFYEFQHGTVDRSRLDHATNQELTAAAIHQEARRLQALGKPVSFAYLGSQPIQSTTGYNFWIVFPRTRVVESIAIDASGKVAGIDFRILVPRTRA